MDEFSFRELYDVTLKATYDIEANGRTIKSGEPIVIFDKIQLANFQEIEQHVTAHGGFEDQARVTWTSTKEIRLNFIQGIFSKLQFAVLLNARLVNSRNCLPLYLNETFEVETDENGQFTLKHAPVYDFYVYDKGTGQKITEVTQVEGLTYEISEPYKELMVHYMYEYENGFTVVNLGQNLTNGYLYLQARTKTKDDITGQVKTGIIIIPKLKIMSALSIRLGRNAEPVVGQFQGVAYPDGPRGQQKVMELIFLEDDIDSDM